MNTVYAGFKQHGFFQFEETEKRRIKAEQLRQDLKHEKQWKDLILKDETALKELEQIQVGPGRMRIPIMLSLAHQRRMMQCIHRLGHNLLSELTFKFTNIEGNFIQTVSES